MSDRLQQARDSQIATIEAHTGRSIADLLTLLDSWGLSKHSEIVSRAKKELDIATATPTSWRTSARKLMHSAPVGPKILSTGSTPATRPTCARCTKA